MELEPRAAPTAEEVEQHVVPGQAELRIASFAH